MTDRPTPIPDAVPPLAPEVAQRRDALPRKPAPATLTGPTVRLEPLDVDAHAESLYAVSDGTPAALGNRAVDAYDADELIWRYMPSGPFDGVEALAADLQRQVDAPDGLCLCAVDVASGTPVGVANLMTNVPEHLRIELGGIWYSPLVQRTGVNAEATYLMLAHVFGLGYRRAEWKCDARNLRSRHAAERMGFRFEGVQEQHMVIKGRNRDTAWFRILDGEWPSVSASLEAMLTL